MYAAMIERIYQTQHPDYKYKKKKKKNQNSKAKKPEGI